MRVWKTNWNYLIAESNAEQEEARHIIEKLRKRVNELEVRMEKVEDDVELAVSQDELDEGDQKIELLEERIATLTVQNVELRDHLNLVIDMLNNVTSILNSQFTNKEPADEAATPHEENPDGEQIYPKHDMDEDTQPTLTQVYAMYQSQPSDEEGWDEMTSAIKAAEEYEARRKVNQNE